MECSETTAPYPIANSTTPVAINETSSTSSVAAATTQSVVTVSVIPVPIPSSSSAAVAASSVYSSPVGASSAGSSAPAASAPAASASVPAASAPAASASVPAGSAPASTACGVVTTYVTVQQTVYVTASQAPSPKPKHTKKHKKHSKVPCSSSSSAVSDTAPSSSSVESVPTPSSTIVAVPPPSAPIATAPLPSSTSSVSQVVQITTSVASSSSVAPAPSSSAPSTPVGTGPYTGPKMGISWDPSQNYELSSVGLSVPPSWAYDWGQQAHGIPENVQYVPTLHDASKCAGFASDLAGSGATYVKHFNEPDETGSGGSGLGVSSAVSLHNQYIAPLMDKYMIGLPAVTSNNIPGTSGTGWLTSFIQQLGSCDGFKFADFHFYGGGEDAATQAKIFLGYVENWISTVDTICPGKDLPIWISEFSATPVGDESLATAFMQIVGPQLEGNPRVGRYAYWFPQNSEIDSVVASVLGAVGL